MKKITRTVVNTVAELYCKVGDEYRNIYFHINGESVKDRDKILKLAKKHFANDETIEVGFVENISYEEITYSMPIDKFIEGAEVEARTE